MADWMYEQLDEKYVLDQEPQVHERSNPPALHKMSGALLEAVPHILDLEGQHSNGTTGARSVVP